MLLSPPNNSISHFLNDTAIEESVDDDYVLVDYIGAPQTTNFLSFLSYMKKASDPKHIGWKIERYEKLIKKIQCAFKNYLRSEKFGEVTTLLVEGPNESPLRQQLYPLLLFCNRQFSSDPERLNQDYLCHVRKIYTDFLIDLRNMAVWSTSNSEDPVIRIVDGLCFTFYTSIDLNSLCKKIVKIFLQLGAKKSGSQSIIGRISDSWKTIHKVDNQAKIPFLKRFASSVVGSTHGLLGSFDPIRQSNPIHVWYTQSYAIKENERTTQFVCKNIAMGTPTTENFTNYWGGPVINPEFLGFLKGCRRNGWTHVYYNQQSMVYDRIADESGRCKVIHVLSEGEFSDLFFVLTLSQNTSYYYQSQRGVTASLLFKTKLLAEIFDVDPSVSGNWISSNLKALFDFKTWAVDVIGIIHSIGFSSKTELDPCECRIFIRLLYLFLFIKVKLVSRPNSYNITCKDGIDRGAATNAEFFLYLAILQGCHTKPYVISFFETLLFSRALIVRKREIVSSRLKRILETAAFMLGNRDMIVAMHHHIFPDVFFQNNRFKNE